MPENIIDKTVVLVPAISVNITDTSAITVVPENITDYNSCT